MVKKILVILGHPYKKSYCNAIVDAYAEGAEQAGAKVQKIYLGDLKFNPVLKWGFAKIQPLEPDLKKAQKIIKWADHLVWVYPNWWSTMPALMKGFIDRTFIPGFGYKFKANHKGWDKYFTKKSAHLIVTMMAPKIIYTLFFKAPGINQLKKGILGFCGVKPVKTTIISNVEQMGNKKRKKWLDKIKEKGEKFI